MFNNKENFIAHTPTVLQMESVECGAASLSMILGYYGKYVSLEKLRVECGISRDGSKASNLLKAARKYDLEAKGYSLDIEDLKKIKVPAILFWNFNHYIVFEGIDRKGNVYINDPAIGDMVIDIEELDRSFTGVVLTFKPTQNFRPDRKKPSMFPSLLRRLKPAKSDLFLAILAGILLGIPGLLVPVFSKIFIDKYLIGGMDEWVLPLIYFMIATAIVNTGLNYLQRHYLLKIQNSISINESSKFFKHILKLPMDFFMQRIPAEIGRRIELNDEVASALSGELAISIIGLVSMVMYATLMFYYDPFLASIAICTIVINLFIFNIITKSISSKSKKLLIDDGNAMSVTIDGLQMIESIKASANEKDFFVKWTASQANLQNSANALDIPEQLSSTIPTLLTALNMVIIIVIGSYRVMDGYMSVGMLIAFQFLMQNFSAPVSDLISLVTSIKELEGDMSYLDDVFKYPIEKRFESRDSIKNAKLTGKIELKNVTFGYSKGDKPLIKNFNLTINPSQRVAIVGSSGSGKSTIAKLITNLYKPNSGEVLIDDMNIDKIDYRILSNSIGYVEQDISLFKGTIKENITLLDETISEKEIVLAAKDAEIHDEITSFSDGYNTFINEDGSNLSGGQKQRLEIARVLLNNPSIIIFDEATSALDPDTEMKIEQNLRKRGVTSIIIAHRLSTIRDSDLIVVMKDGKIVEKGTHDTLKQQEGIYAKLIKNI